jgi:hypothetical protein
MSLTAENSGVISTQVMQEFYVAATSKLRADPLLIKDFSGLWNASKRWSSHRLSSRTTTIPPDPNIHHRRWPYIYPRRKKLLSLNRQPSLQLAAHPFLLRKNE